MSEQRKTLLKIVEDSTDIAREPYTTKAEFLEPLKREYFPTLKKEYWADIKKGNFPTQKKNILKSMKRGAILLTDAKFYSADDVASMLSVSKPTAYRIIKRLNDELSDKGFIVVSGRVPRRYFDEKFYC